MKSSHDRNMRAATVAGAAASVADRRDGQQGHVTEVLRNFRVIYQAIQRHSRWVEQSCGVTAAQLWAIWALSRSPGLSVSDLSQVLMIHPSTASNLLDKLESKDLVERRREGPDQRVVHLYPTAASRAILDKAPRPAQGALIDALERMSESQLTALKRSLNKLVEQLNDHDAQSGFSPIVNQ